MRALIIATTVVAGLFSSPALAQQPSQGTASIPDLSGLWGDQYLYGIEPPLSGPGPVLNRSRISIGPQKDKSNPFQLVGDYTNPILKPQAAEVVKKRRHLVSRRGLPEPT